MTAPDLYRRVPAGDRLAGRCLRTVARALSGHAPTRELEELARAVARPVTTGRRIAVVSARGGAGRSTVAALLGMVLAARRADPVLAVDADPENGSLSWRLGVPYGPRLDELAAHLDDDPMPHLGRGRGGVWFLPGGSERPTLARDAARTLSRRFPVSVIDCGAVTDPATQAVLGEAHAVVVVCPTGPDGVRSTAGLLAGVPPEERGRAVVALNTVHRDARAVLGWGAVRARLGPFEVPVVDVPYDRHLAAAAPIDPARVGERTLVATSRLAARALAAARPL